MIYYISNELSHHGVKGMRWGIHKQRALSPRLKKTGNYAKAAAMTVAGAHAGMNLYRAANSSVARKGSAYVASKLASGHALKTASYAQYMNVGMSYTAAAFGIGLTGALAYKGYKRYIKSNVNN